MPIKRLFLILLTLVAIAFFVFSLFESLQQPQIQSRLELYQTNILLQAAQWQPEDSNEAALPAVREAIVGAKPLEAATEQYQDARELVETNLQKAKNQLAELSSAPATTPATPKPQPEVPPVTNTSRQLQQKQLQQSLNQLQKLQAEIYLRLGILQAAQGQTDKAQEIWASLPERSQITLELVETADVLQGIWNSPPRILPDAEPLIQENLEGWFRYQALSQLYQLQQRPDALAQLQAVQQDAAQNALVKLAIIATIPGLSGFIGIGLLIFLIGQWLVKGKDAVLAKNADQAWSIPWGGETVLQVFIFGFFLMGQFVVPTLLSLIPINRAAVGVQFQAFFVLLSYLLVASGALLVLYLSIRRFLPLPKEWFCFRLRDSWFLWGLGGYCVAIPLVVVVSLINQQLWQGQGGSNPLLQLALESQDTLALAIFFFTAGIAAPLFEEFLFRGFLLPSLTRYFPVWGAIVASSLFFAIAHLSLSEILPLTTLGMVLGIVYTRSRNLLAPMLLHGLWNSGTLLSLFLLGSGSS